MKKYFIPKTSEMKIEPLMQLNDTSPGDPGQDAAPQRINNQYTV